MREKLPNSINGLWKADLFVGKSEPDKWVGTTVKLILVIWRQQED